MKKALSCLLGLVLGIGFVSSVNAEQWQIVGPRALGMGGAHVAVVNDATASYWNPAAFGFFGREAENKKNKDEDEDEHTDRDWGLHIHGGAGGQIHENLAEEVNDILNYDYNDLSNKASAATLTLAEMDDFLKMTAEVRDLNKAGLGITALANAGISARVKNFGIGMYVLGEVSADPNVDITNLGVSGGIATLAGLGGSQQNIFTAAQRADLIASVDAMTGWSTVQATNYVNSLDQALYDVGMPAGTVTDQQIQAAKDIAQAAAGGSLSDNDTHVLFKGAAVAEAPLTYGHAFNDNFSLGGNVKFMRGEVFYQRVKVFNKEKNNFYKDFDQGSATSSNFGVDLGGLAKFKDFRLGIVGRNLNNPEFDAPTGFDSKKYQIDSQVRAGIAYMPTTWLTFAADIDVTENNTPFGPYDSQLVGGGVELALLKFLYLRGGIYDNIAAEGSNEVYTAGVGLNFWLFQLDAGVAVSKDTASLNGTTIPEKARAEVALSFQF